MENNVNSDNLPVWEVFIQVKNGGSFQHVGNVHAADKELAMQNARDLYTRRMEGTCIWIVRSENIISSNSADEESFFDPANDKVYRYPTFFKVSKKVKDIKMKNSLFKFVLILADDALIIGQRLSEWAYKAQFLVEDI